MWHDVPNRGGNDRDLSNDLFARGRHAVCSAAGRATTPAPRRVPANADCLPPYVAPCAAPVFANHYVKTPVLAGVTGKIFGRIINRSGTNAAPLNVMGNPIPYFPANADRQHRRDAATCI